MWSYKRSLSICAPHQVEAVEKYNTAMLRWCRFLQLFFLCPCKGVCCQVSVYKLTDCTQCVSMCSLTAADRSANSAEEKKRGVEAGQKRLRCCQRHQVQLCGNNISFSLHFIPLWSDIKPSSATSCNPDMWQRKWISVCVWDPLSPTRAPTFLHASPHLSTRPPPQIAESVCFSSNKDFWGESISHLIHPSALDMFQYFEMVNRLVSPHLWWGKQGNDVNVYTSCLQALK